MDPVSLASIAVAGIAAASAYASQKAASKASEANTKATVDAEVEIKRADRETEAYERARSYDTETIRRQDEEILELREDNKRLHAEVKMLRNRIARLERGIPLDSEENIRERASDDEPISE